jgi:hypothetical protein
MRISFLVVVFALVLAGAIAVSAVNAPPTITLLSSNLPEPQAAGTSITWTCSAVDERPGMLKYRYELRGPATGGVWQMVRNWGWSNQWTWETNPGDIDPGNDIRCKAKDVENQIAAKIKFNYAITNDQPLTIPDAPSNLQATAVTGTQISLSWEDNSDNEDGFKIRRGVHPLLFSQIADVSPGVTAFNDYGLSPGTTYYYRVYAYNNAGNSDYTSDSATTPGDAQAILKIVNNGHYPLVDIRLNGQQMVYYPEWLAPGGTYTVPFDTPGTVNINLGAGFYDENHNRDIWFTYADQVTVSSGQTTTYTVNSPTIGQLLSNFNPTGRDFIGQYWCFDCDPIVGYAKFHFTYGGSWTFYDNNVQMGSGSVILVNWPDYSYYVNFKICATCEVIQFWYPFGTFYYENGPPDWPIIEYIGQG